jgi:hypothetical protein
MKMFMGVHKFTVDSSLLCAFVQNEMN